MKYTINYHINDDFLKVILDGEYPVEKFREISADMDKVIDENGISRIMVDLRKFSGRFGVFNGLQEIENFREESKYLQFAIIDVPENKSNNDFFENASFNRGYKLLFFYNVEDAEKWLGVDGNVDFEKVLVKEY
ncbi:MAG TPA: hypothetical protein PKE39_13745 [Ignavibacteria bacterium]|nr:hypothetical protein [Ignavibacteria bacterium]HMR00081.1 hypothetical protein [Ignavibacteria bacterium]